MHEVRKRAREPLLCTCKHTMTSAVIRGWFDCIQALVWLGLAELGTENLHPLAVPEDCVMWQQAMCIISQSRRVKQREAHFLKSGSFHYGLEQKHHQIRFNAPVHSEHSQKPSPGIAFHKINISDETMFTDGRVKFAGLFLPLAKLLNLQIAAANKHWRWLRFVLEVRRVSDGQALMQRRPARALAKWRLHPRQPLFVSFTIQHFPNARAYSNTPTPSAPFQSQTPHF